MRSLNCFLTADFRHHLTLRRGVAGEFFTPSSADDEVLRERRQWIASAPRRYANLTDEGGPLVAEFLALCTTWKVLADSSACHEGFRT